MTYLLSLLKSSSSTKTSPPILCYHINNTSDTQMIRVMDESICCFDRIIFAGERILFEAFSDSCLEIYSSTLSKTWLSRIICESLKVNEHFAEQEAHANEFRQQNLA